MKKILFVHQSSSIGGGSYCLLNIVKNLDRQLFCPIVALNSNGPLVSELEKLGVEVVVFSRMSPIPYNHTLLRIRSIISYIRVLQSKKAFRDILRIHKIDILYLNNMMIYPYLKDAKECGCKTIMHVREHWPLEENKIQLNWARNTVYKYCDELIAINKYSASIFPNKKATIVYDWINMDKRYEEIPMSSLIGTDDKDKKIFLFTGGIPSIKGGLKIADCFIKYNSSPDSILLMLGVDTRINYTGLYGYIRKILSYINIYSRSDQLKKLVKKDKRIICAPSIYNLSHIIKQSHCVLSYFTIPHANLAMAESIILGVPYIAARTDESIEYTNNKLPELLFEINNIESYKKTLAYVDENYNTVKKHCEEISDEIKLIFDEANNIARLRQILSKFIQ